MERGVNELVSLCVTGLVSFKLKESMYMDR